MTVVSEVANALHHSGCLRFGDYRIKSGALSPYYIDIASLLGSPCDFLTIRDIISEKIREFRISENVDKLASIELKGALLLPSIACRANLPCIVVRKERKTYGATGRTVGADIVKGERLLFFDDVISEGLSKLEGMKVLEQLGGKVENVMVVVDREQGGKEKLEKLGYRTCALAKISELVSSLFQSSNISKEKADVVLDYIKSVHT